MGSTKTPSLPAAERVAPASPPRTMSSSCIQDGDSKYFQHEDPTAPAHELRGARRPVANDNSRRKRPQPAIPEQYLLLECRFAPAIGKDKRTDKEQDEILRRRWRHQLCHGRSTIAGSDKSRCQYPLCGTPQRDDGPLFADQALSLRWREEKPGGFGQSGQ